MEELEKILEEIEQRIEKAKKIIVEHPSDKMDEIANDTAEAFIEAYKECQDIIRTHMNDSKCGNCSRRKWYQIGYKDGKNDGWIPVEEKVPDSGIYIFLSFTNFTLPMIGRYEKDSDGGAFYIGDEEETCVSQDLYVNAWCPLPDPYRPEQPDTCKYTGGSCLWPIDQCGECLNHPERGK